jgi:tRNA A37 threonylcarbamoyladenosine dehydratase
MLSDEYQQRFGGLGRMFGLAALEPLQRAQFCIVGVGGVGSWAAEACVRSGIGNITLIDHDDIHISNTNRQLHTLVDSIERSKVEVLRERIIAINPECNCNAIDDLVTRGSIEKAPLPAQQDPLRLHGWSRRSYRSHPYHGQRPDPELQRPAACQGTFDVTPAAGLQP